MKPKVLFIAFLLLLSINVYTQDRGGCDLCGPASGSSQNTASGNYSATIGVNCEAKGSFSLAVGNAAKSNASMTTAIGKFVRANATNSVVIGSGISDTDTRSLMNNKANSLMIGFNSTYPTLYVSPSLGYSTTGKVGIGNVTNPKSKLHIKSDANEDAGIILEPSTLSNTSYVQFINENYSISCTEDKGMHILSKNDKISIHSDFLSMNTKVGINVTDNYTENYDFALAVSGGILTNEILIKEVSEWYDFVFDDDYELLSLNDLETYIEINGHLPDIPSSDEVKNDGYNMVILDALLLKKIEELTIYTIELNKLLQKQQRFIDELQKK